MHGFSLGISLPLTAYVDCLGACSPYRTRRAQPLQVSVIIVALAPDTCGELGIADYDAVIDLGPSTEPGVQRCWPRAPAKFRGMGPAKFRGMGAVL